jgi:glutathione S-transferase
MLPRRAHAVTSRPMSVPRLWSWSLSPFAGKARIAFAEKGVAVQLLEIDPRHRPARLREINPTNRVPVLEVGDTAIRESTAICEWLEETQSGPALWPSDPQARARARGLLRWVDDELTTNFFLSCRKEAFGLDASDHPDLVNSLRGRLLRRWPVADRLLSLTDGPWLAGGPDPTLPDLAAIPLAVRLPQWKPELAPDGPGLERVTDWLQRLRERPSAAEVDRHGEPVTAG